jgi:hypothetical protein
VTSGEVLITNYAVRGTGAQRTIVADLGMDLSAGLRGSRVGRWREDRRQIISTTEMAPFGSHHFEIPFNATARSGCALPHGIRPVTARLCNR